MLWNFETKGAPYGRNCRFLWLWCFIGGMPRQISPSSPNPLSNGSVIHDRFFFFFFFFCTIKHLPGEQGRRTNFPLSLSAAATTRSHLLLFKLWLKCFIKGWPRQISPSSLNPLTKGSVILDERKHKTDGRLYTNQRCLHKDNFTFSYCTIRCFIPPKLGRPSGD